MKYILILLTLALFGCGGQREKEHSQLMFQRSIELLRANELVAKYKEPENIARPLIVRDYKTADGSKLQIVTPADCYLGTELEFKFKDLKENQLIICDVTYWLPSKDFVICKLLPSFRHANKMIYSNKFDCDDFSRQFAFYSQMYYVGNVINKNMQAIAVSEIHYWKRSRVMGIKLKLPLEVDVPIPWYFYEKHAINCIVLDDESLLFVEPQSGQVVELSSEEIKSIYYCRF